MYEVENPMVRDLPQYKPCDSEEYWWNHADDGTDAQDELDYCSLEKRLTEEKKRRIEKGEWDAICEENFQWLIKH